MRLAFSPVANAVSPVVILLLLFLLLPLHWWPAVATENAKMTIQGCMAIYIPLYGNSGIRISPRSQLYFATLSLHPVATVTLPLWPSCNISASVYNTLSKILHNTFTSGCFQPNATATGSLATSRG